MAAYLGRGRLAAALDIVAPVFRRADDNHG
jgi:hypothetical protein